MSKTDFKRKMSSEDLSKSGLKISNSEDFKVALSTICNNADYKMLEEQFFGKAEK